MHVAHVAQGAAVWGGGDAPPAGVAGEAPFADIHIYKYM